MSGTVSQEALLPELAVGELGALRALLSGRRTRGRLDARLDTDTQDTLLTWAARHGHAEAVRLLLEAGASVGAADGEGASALVLACEAGRLECAQLLLAAGAAVDQAEDSGCTPPGGTARVRQSASQGRRGGRPSR
jgi:ankyrin repeat protein